MPYLDSRLRRNDGFDPRPTARLGHPPIQWHHDGVIYLAESASPLIVKFTRLGWSGGEDFGVNVIGSMRS